MRINIAPQGKPNRLSAIGIVLFILAFIGAFIGSWLFETNTEVMPYVLVGSFALGFIGIALCFIGAIVSILRTAKQVGDIFKDEHDQTIVDGKVVDIEAKQKKTCPYCGNEIKDEEYCPHCGAKQFFN